MERYLPTGSELLSLPRVNEKNGAVEDLGFLHMGSRGLIELRGGEAEHFTVYAVTAYAWPWNDNYTITFNRNGGYGDAPGSIEAEAGTQVELPDYDGWRYGYVFVG